MPNITSKYAEVVDLHADIYYNGKVHGFLYILKNSFKKDIHFLSPCDKDTRAKPNLLVK
ncbi:hypothetical protein GA0061094_1199 [[Bacillus] enclensis]|uniref:Uncharacterized protein n=1 Tax=[Bacillus] enclensis TaxID=1402860 RepID=A0A1C4A2Z7_9BACI|nr:hypothetical protein GA0061094_1199 [[Bacillus] enclensis]